VSYASSSITPVLFPTVIYNSSQMYNDAYVLVEINNDRRVADSLHIDFEYENLWEVFTGNKTTTTVCGFPVDTSWFKNVTTSQCLLFKP
jgi:hypothetical protein